jgi:hypothetical protein
MGQPSKATGVCMGALAATIAKVQIRTNAQGGLNKIFYFVFIHGVFFFFFNLNFDP